VAPPSPGTPPPRVIVTLPGATLSCFTARHDPLLFNNIAVRVICGLVTGGIANLYGVILSHPEFYRRISNSQWNLKFTTMYSCRSCIFSRLNLVPYTRRKQKFLLSLAYIVHHSRIIGFCKFQRSLMSWNHLIWALHVSRKQHSIRKKV